MHLFVEEYENIEQKQEAFWSNIKKKFLSYLLIYCLKFSKLNWP